MKVGDKVVVVDDDVLKNVSDVRAGNEGVILSEEWVDTNEDDGDEPDGFFVEFINERGLKERWQALKTELELAE